MTKVAVGFDPSLTGLAMCCIAGDGTIVETVLPKSEPKGDSIGARIGRYRLHANNAVAWLQQHAPGGPLLIEGYSYGSKGSAVLTLAEFGCYLRTKLIVSGFMPIEVAPTTLKKFATGKGKGDKVVIAAALARRYDRDFPGGDNQADAFCLAKMHACMVGIDEPQTDAQREAIGKAQSQFEAELKSKPW